MMDSMTSRVIDLDQEASPRSTKMQPVGRAHNAIVTWRHRGVPHEDCLGCK
jgi:hypothetical protein